MLLTFFAFIVVLGVVVFVHELGHFLAARATGCRVEVFSVGFGRLWGFKRGDTEYQIGYIPFGGYVKIAGMVDEFLEDEPITGAEDEFQSKNAAQKIFIMVAGVLMNFLLGFLLYTFIPMVEGEGKLVDKAVIGSVAEQYPAEEAGLLPGARVISVNGESIDSWEQFRDAIHSRPGEQVELSWVAEQGDTMQAQLTTRAEMISDVDGTREVGMVGVGPSMRYVDVGPLRSVELGARTTWNVISLSLRSIGMLVTGKASVKDLTGPAGIVYLSGETARAGWLTFFSFIALISVSIGLLNILPFPVLDGGHVVYVLIETVIGRQIAPKIKLTLQQVGMVLLLLLFVIVTYHDVVRFFLP